MKKFLILFFVLSAFLFANNKPSPTNEFFVNDFANIIQPANKQAIQAIAEDLYSKTKAQIVVVTIPSLDGEALEDYSLDLFRQWQIGDKETNKGILLLIAVQDRKSRVEVGYGLEGILPDGKTGRMQDELMIPFFKEGDYSTGITNIMFAFAQEIYKEAGLEMPENLTPKIPQQIQHKEITLFQALMIMLAIFGLLILDVIFFKGRIANFLFWFALIALSRGRGGRGGSGGGGFSGGGGSGGGGGSSRGW